MDKQECMDIMDGWLKRSPEISVATLLDALVHAVMAQNGSLDQYLFQEGYQKVSPKPKEPELIQGYTKEQWQEVIDGEYLCEFEGNGSELLGELVAIEIGKEYQFEQKTSSVIRSMWSNCRPAKLKGVMRPVFVKPEDKGVMCVFFNSHGDVLGSLQWCDMPIFSKTEHATKYIEL